MNAREPLPRPHSTRIGWLQSAAVVLVAALIAYVVLAYGIPWVVGR